MKSVVVGRKGCSIEKCVGGGGGGGGTEGFLKGERLKSEFIYFIRLYNDFWQEGGGCRIFNLPFLPPTHFKMELYV